MKHNSWRKYTVQEFYLILILFVMFNQLWIVNTIILVAVLIDVTFECCEKQDNQILDQL